MTSRAFSPGYNWAKRHAFRSAAADAAWEFQDRLEQSQWYAPERHLAHQLRHLTAVARHAVTNVPYYSKTLDGIGLSRDLTLDEWRALPILTRQQLQANREGLTAATYPASHGRPQETGSSGSTGRPVRVIGTDLTQNWHKSLTLRAQLWSTNRFDRKLASIRRYREGVAELPEGFSAGHWADEMTLPMATGPVAALSVHVRIPDQAAWLMRERPQMLVTYPSNLLALAKHGMKAKLPQLRRILTIGEVLSDETRAAAREAFGAEVFDAYSANEVGYVAVQCPDCALYHVQSEALLVEVIDDAGRPCVEGETGRVVVSLLYNYAMPLIRYALGDYATVGAPCHCGRGMPTLRRILGRTRNMMALPDGSRFWPSFGTRFMHETGVDQVQFVQHTTTSLEVRLSVRRPLTEGEEGTLRARLAARLPVPMDIRFEYYDEIPRSAEGKFEDLICLVPD